MEDTFITKPEFLEGQQWYWQGGDMDVWFYDSQDNKVKQVEGDLYADVNELGDTTFNYTSPGEDTQFYSYEWLLQYNA